LLKINLEILDRKKSRSELQGWTLIYVHQLWRKQTKDCRFTTEQTLPAYLSLDNLAWHRKCMWKKNDNECNNCGRDNQTIRSELEKPHTKLILCFPTQDLSHSPPGRTMSCHQLCHSDAKFLSFSIRHLFIFCLVGF
jgi:ferredoxin